MNPHDVFMAFSAHCRERADYYREWYLRTHNEQFLEIELSLRRLASKAIVSAQETETPVALDPVDDVRGPIEQQVYPHSKPAKPSPCGCD